jgi:hypothetical protein
VVLPPVRASVSGIVYKADAGIEDAPQVTLFTKEGCTLCDKVKDSLKEVCSVWPHSLVQVDITDEEHKDFYDRYKVRTTTTAGKGK